MDAIFGNYSSSSSDEEEKPKDESQQEAKLTTKPHATSPSNPTSTSKVKLLPPSEMFKKMTTSSFVNNKFLKNWEDLPVSRASQKRSLADVEREQQAAITGPYETEPPPELEENITFTKKSAYEAVAQLKDDIKKPKIEKPVETFQQKEKRKRDMGQASRGKSYVEEEKRLLRGSGGAGYGFD